jgi:hypothetical protein
MVHLLANELPGLATGPWTVVQFCGGRAGQDLVKALAT